MNMALGFLVSFIISIFTLFLIVKVFGSSDVDLRTVAVAAGIITVTGFVLCFIPVVGPIVALIINIYIVMSIMECSGLMAFLAIIMWGALQALVEGYLGIGLRLLGAR